MLLSLKPVKMLYLVDFEIYIVITIRLYPIENRIILVSNKLRFLWGLCGFVIIEMQNLRTILLIFRLFSGPVGCISFIFVVKCSLLTIQYTRGANH